MASRKNFLTAYKEAGFKTFWLSNQISFGQFDTPVSVFAKEADVIQFMNLGGFTNNSNFDQILLEPLQHAIADPAPKKLIVLHTLGNHWNYSQRYPKAFDKWQPSLFGVDKPVYTDTEDQAAAEQQLRQLHPVHRLVPVAGDPPAEGHAAAELDGLRGRPRPDPV
jgi:glucan phosphoethanolaminetransferase (alkaline phosphatase superfamily)